MKDGDNSLKEDLESVEDPAEQIQKAYDNAQKTPWTIARQSAAMMMGSTILSGVFSSEIKELSDTGTYSHAVRDVVIVTWLLSLTEAQVIRINARQKIDEAIADAYLWAEKEGIKYGSAKYLDGVRTLAEIIRGTFASFYAVEGKKPEAPRKNDSRRPGRSGRPTTQLKPAGTTPTTSGTK